MIKPGEHAPLHLVIDVGGTLADLHKISLAALKQLSPHKEQVRREQIIKAATPYWRDDFSFFFLNTNIMSELFDGTQNPGQLLAEYRSRALKLLRETSNIRPLFLSLLAHEHTLSIATNGTVEATLAILDALSISDLVTRGQLHVSEEYGVFKRNGTIHQAIRQRYGDREIWCVGDSVVEDLIPGAASGMTPIWVTEFCDSDALRELPPAGTKTIRSIHDLPNLIRSTHSNSD